MNKEWQRLKHEINVRNGTRKCKYAIQI